MTLGSFLRNVPIVGHEAVVSVWKDGEEVQNISDTYLESGRTLLQKCKGLLRHEIQFVFASADTLRVEIDITE